MLDNSGAFVFKKTHRGQQWVVARKGNREDKFCSLLIKGFLRKRWFRLRKNCPNFVVMLVQLSPSTPVHREWDGKRQLHHGIGACPWLLHPVFSKWCSEKVPAIQDRDRSASVVSGFCMLYSWYCWDLTCYRRFSWPEGWSQLLSAWKWN